MEISLVLPRAQDQLIRRLKTNQIHGLYNVWARATSQRLLKLYLCFTRWCSCTAWTLSKLSYMISLHCQIACWPTARSLCLEKHDFLRQCSLKRILGEREGLGQCPPDSTGFTYATTRHKTLNDENSDWWNGTKKGTQCWKDIVSDREYPTAMMNWRYLSLLAVSAHTASWGDRKQGIWLWLWSLLPQRVIWMFTEY